MLTIYLRFGDRAGALAALAAALGYGSALDPEGGETWPATGTRLTGRCRHSSSGNTTA